MAKKPDLKRSRAAGSFVDANAPGEFVREHWGAGVELLYQKAFEAFARAAYVLERFGVGVCWVDEECGFALHATLESSATATELNVGMNTIRGGTVKTIAKLLVARALGQLRAQAFDEEFADDAEET